MTDHTDHHWLHHLAIGDNQLGADSTSIRCVFLGIVTDYSSGCTLLTTDVDQRSSTVLVHEANRNVEWIESLAS